MAKTPSHSILLPAYGTVVFDGVPMFRCQAWALKDARLSGVPFRVNSADRRKGVPERFGKLSQDTLYRRWVARWPGYFPANRPGFSSHELRSDGNWFYGIRGSRIPRYKLGIDAANRAGGDSAQLVHWLNSHGYRAVRPYASGSERHHFSFSKSPATNARRRMRRHYKAGSKR